MMADIVWLFTGVCFGTGCGVRLWRWFAGPRNPKLQSGSDQRVRLQVRRPAVDVPVECQPSGRSDHDPVLP